MIDSVTLSKIGALWRMRPETPLDPKKIDMVRFSDRVTVNLPECENTREAQVARMIANNLLQAHRLDWDVLRTLAPASLIGMPQALALALHEEIKGRLLALTEALLKQQEKGRFTADSQLYAECILNNTLNYGAQFGYELGDTITLPVFENGKVRAVLYEIGKLSLTGDKISSPYPCYTLSPVEDKQAPAQLIFKSTTYPGSEGFLWTVISDLKPFSPIGASLFQQGSATIEAWINAQKNPVILHGHSLGGTIALLAADAFTDNVQRAFAYGPAGTYQEDLNGEKSTIIYGASDPVCLLGNMPSGAKYVYALPNQTFADSKDRHFASDTGIRGGFASHALGIPSHPQARLFRVSDNHMMTGHINRTAVQRSHTVAKMFGFVPLVAAQFVTATFRAGYRLCTGGLNLVRHHFGRPNDNETEQDQPAVHPSLSRTASYLPLNELTGACIKAPPDEDNIQTPTTQTRNRQGMRLFNN